MKGTCVIKIFVTFIFLNCALLTAETTKDFSVIAKKTLNDTWARIIQHNFEDNSANEKWQKIYKKACPEILKSRNPRELVRSINVMIEELGQSHIHLIPPVSRKAKKALSLQVKSRRAKAHSSSNKQETGRNKAGIKKSDTLKGKAAGVGLRTCVADGKLCVLNVTPNSPATSAGIKMGDIIHSIHGFQFDLSKYTDLPWDMMADSMLTGNYGTKVSLEFANSNGNIQKKILERRSVHGSWIRLGVMPKISGIVEYKILEGDIGYIYITPCFPQQIIQMHTIITKKLMNCKGLIIDLRNNPGGMMMMAQGMAGWVSDKELDMGKMKTRETPLLLKSYPQEGAYTGPLAIIVNGGTFSTAEVFAAGIQDNKRGKVFGETTGGKCLPSLFFVLSTGYRLQTVFGDYIRSNGKRVEVKGVKPDVSVSAKHKDLLLGIDTARETARKWLEKQ